jgi:hypothetical protein
MKTKNGGSILILALGLLMFGAIAIWAQDNTQSNLNGPASQPLSVAPANSKTGSSDVLCFLLIGTLLGAAGQVARAAVGLKKEMDAAAAASPQKKWDEWFDARQLLVSVLFGAVAGVLASVAMMGAEIDKKFLLGCLAAGYAGSDFIEGFMSKNLPA